MNEQDFIPHKKKDNGVVIGSIICFAIGSGLLLISSWSAFISGMFIFISFILAIIAMAKDNVAWGIVLIIANLIIPPSIFMINVGLSTVKAINETQNEIQAEEASSLEYASRIDIYNVEAKMYKSFGSEEPGISFAVKNRGDSTVTYLKATFYFKDANGEYIFEKDQVIVNTNSLFGNTTPLKPNYEIESDGYYSVTGVPSSWDVGNIDFEITDIEIE